MINYLSDEESKEVSQYSYFRSLKNKLRIEYLI